MSVDQIKTSLLAALALENAMTNARWFLVLEAAGYGTAEEMRTIYERVSTAAKKRRP